MEALNVLDGTDLPVIDLSLFPSQNVDQSELESHEFNELRQACQELGFFRVINHGINPTLVQAGDGMIREMFELPAEIKNRAIFPIFNTGYGPSQVDDVAKDSIPESMCFPGDHQFPNSVEKISAKLWPQGNPVFCEQLNAYKAQMRELSHRILKLIVWSLGVDISSQSVSELFEKSYGFLRLNYYDKSTDKEMISKAHKDISCLTILYQDDVGGLQIRTKQGKWMDSKPFPGSFVINVGAILQDPKLSYATPPTRRQRSHLGHDLGVGPVGGSKAGGMAGGMEGVPYPPIYLRTNVGGYGPRSGLGSYY